MIRMVIFALFSITAMGTTISGFVSGYRPAAVCWSFLIGMAFVSAAIGLRYFLNRPTRKQILLHEPQVALALSRALDTDPRGKGGKGRLP